jgi:hydrogenase maturation protease
VLSVENRSILVLGVGNVLLSDEGTGVHLVNKLARDFTFSENVTLLDGGTLGTRLLGPISTSSFLIVADIAVHGSPPGTLYRLTMEDLRAGIEAKNSMHQVSFTETIALAEMMEILPPLVVIAIEPQDMHTMVPELTPAIAAKMGDMTALVLKEIERAGGWYKNAVTSETDSYCFFPTIP